MLNKPLISVAVGLAVGLSPYRNCNIVKILILVTGVEMLINLLVTTGIYLFFSVRTIKLVKNSVNVTESLNPLTLAKNVTFVVVDC